MDRAGGDAMMGWGCSPDDTITYMLADDSSELKSESVKYGDIQDLAVGADSGRVTFHDLRLRTGERRVYAFVAERMLLMSMDEQHRSLPRREEIRFAVTATMTRSRAATP